MNSLHPFTVSDTPDNFLMPKNKDTPEKLPPESLALGEGLHAEIMLYTAQSLSTTLLKLQQYSPSWPEQSIELQHGVFSSQSILLPFAIELALKAWHWRDYGTDADNDHNLLLLFDALKPSTRNLLEDRMSSLNLCLQSQSIIPPHDPLSLREVLFIHRHTFQTSRYAAHYIPTHKNLPLLRLVVAMLTDSYDKHFESQNKQFNPKDCPTCHLPSDIHSYDLYSDPLKPLTLAYNHVRHLFESHPLFKSLIPEQ